MAPYRPVRRVQWKGRTVRVGDKVKYTAKGRAGWGPLDVTIASIKTRGGVKKVENSRHAQIQLHIPKDPWDEYVCDKLCL